PNLSEALAFLKRSKVAAKEVPADERPSDTKRPRLDAGHPSPSAHPSEPKPQASLQAGLARLHARFDCQKRPPVPAAESDDKPSQLRPSSGDVPPIEPPPPVSADKTIPSPQPRTALNLPPIPLTPRGSSRAEVATPSTQLSSFTRSTTRGAELKPTPNLPQFKHILGCDVKLAASNGEAAKPRLKVSAQVSAIGRAPRDGRQPSEIKPTSSWVDESGGSSRVAHSPDAPSHNSEEDSSHSFLDSNSSQAGRRRPPGPAGYYARRQNGQANGASPSHAEPDAEAGFLSATFFQVGDAWDTVGVFPVGKVLGGAYSAVYRVPGLAVVVKRVLDLDTNAYVLFADPTGEISGSVAHQVFHRQPRFLDPGTVWVLRDVALIRPGPKRLYLNVVGANLVQVFAASTPLPPASPAGAELEVGLSSTPSGAPTPAASPTGNPRPPPSRHPRPHPPGAVELTQGLVEAFFDEFDIESGPAKPAKERPSLTGVDFKGSQPSDKREDIILALTGDLQILRV
ncbi:hypothetical protein L0F63_000633, partial [Massospora cicadina]